MTNQAQHTNRLAGETSPYLLQHAHNPVDWYPWGKDALERATTEGKPILLSIGYAACHWCHVMERESFESDDIAKVMNENFVCIKVDREERPDLDEIYMAATVALSGSGGWPMTVFLAPDQRPFFAGTYFPPTDRYGRPGFRTLLLRIADAWNADREALLEQAAVLTTHVRSQTETMRPLNVNGDAIASAARDLEASFDPEHGGFSQAPKFPPSSALSLLLRHYRRVRSDFTLRMATTTLDGMKNGGMYDHLAGGFARYSTDERWLVPHFEKMLYDNAQLARVYLEAYQVTRNEEYRRVAAETLDYIVREMQSKDGGYYSATDADSEGVEGKFFVWTPEQVEEVLDEQSAEWFCRYYDVTPQGNWEGVSILHTSRPLDDVARELGVDKEELDRSLQASKRMLYAARERRIHPLLDDKILTSWNGLMIGAMAEGYRVLGDRRYLVSAEHAAQYLLGPLRKSDGGFYRTARAGKAHLDAYLEDYAYVADALLDLYEAGGAPGLVGEALAIAERLVQGFDDPQSGAFYFTAHGHEALIARPREGHDGALPNANAVAARVLARLSVHFDRDDLRERAMKAIRAYGRLIERSPRAFAMTLSVVDFLLESPLELVFVGSPGEGDYAALVEETARHFLPNRVVAHVDPKGAKPSVMSPLIEGKTLVDSRAALYICKNFTCRTPVTDPSAVASMLENEDVAQRTARSQALPGATVSGFATPEATEHYVSRFRSRYAATAYRRLGATGLNVSALGFGTYRVDDRSPDHRAALKTALESGVNLIDTSTNYSDGHSERLVGEVIAELVLSASIRRDEIVVVTKIGYVQGQNLSLAEQRENDRKPYPEMVKYGDGIWHCIHPEWLEAQLSRSLDRLGLETVDACLLHNPEYFLSKAAKNGGAPLEDARTEFYRRLRNAFAHLEKEVQRGRIRHYGVSSNTAISATTDPEATSLARMLEAAALGAGSKHHFHIVQVPMNLFETDALLQKNTGEDGRSSVLEFALAHDLAVLVNRPLNAIVGKSLIRLAEAPASAGAPGFATQLELVRKLEEEFAKTFAPSLRPAPGARLDPKNLLRWADRLADVAARVDSLEEWRDLETDAIKPQIAQIVGALDRGLSSSHADSWTQFRKRYLPAIDGLLGALGARAADRSRARSGALVRALDPALPDAWRKESLSRKALGVLTSTPGVTAVLVGMRRAEYVDDSIGALGLEALTDPVAAIKAVSAASVSAT